MINNTFERIRQSGSVAGRRSGADGKPLTEVFICSGGPLRRSTRRQVEADRRVICSISAVDILETKARQEVYFTGRRPNEFHEPSLRWAFAQSNVALIVAPSSAAIAVVDTWFAQQFPAARWVTLVRTIPQSVDLWADFARSHMAAKDVYTHSFTDRAFGDAGGLQ